MKTKVLLASVFSLTCIAVLAASFQTELFALTNIVKPVSVSSNLTNNSNFQIKPPVNVRPKVELVFALDTTGSMDGLIAAAKEKIWSIASTMASARPAPEISIGFVAYRDKGDIYITRKIELSKDLDEVYGQLLQLEAGGGGDSPESVNFALYEAVFNMNWSQYSNSYKVIFLVGDAPGHNDYLDDTPFNKTLEHAAQKGIIVNTIQAGHDPEMIKSWQEIAALGGGDSFQVGEQGSAIAINTPFDQEIIKASKDFEDTRVFYGEKVEQQKQNEKSLDRSRILSVASPASLARRAKFNSLESGKENFASGNELIVAIERNEISLSSIPKAELPVEMQSMDLAEQKVFIENKVKLRNESKRKLTALSEKRDVYIKQELSKNNSQKDSLDEKLYSTLMTQAKKKGLDYSKAESSY